MRYQVLASFTALGLLAACGDSGAAYNSFYREAGSVVDSGSFGNATMQNSLVMTNAEQYAQNLNDRFAAQVPTTINFAFNSYVLNDSARAVLRQQADFIRQFPEVRFKVYGHTDLVGSTSYNRELGLRRAEAAVLYLQSQGISRSRLEAVVSYGETRPIVVTQGREKSNRRTVTEVTGFVSAHPSIMDGKYAEVIFREYVTSAQPAQTLRGSIASSDG